MLEGRRSLSPIINHLRLFAKTRPSFTKAMSSVNIHLRIYNRYSPHFGQQEYSCRRIIKNQFNHNICHRRHGELAYEQADEELQQELQSPSSSLEFCESFFYLKPMLICIATPKTIFVHSFQWLCDEAFSTWYMDCRIQAEELQTAHCAKIRGSIWTKTSLPEWEHVASLPTSKSHSPQSFLP